MTEYVTFIGRDQSGSPIDATVVWVQAPDGSTVVQDQFGPALPGVGPRTVPIAAGEYFMSARADGFKFPYLVPLSVPLGIAPIPASPLVVYVDGVTSLAAEQSFRFKTFGWVRTPSPNASPGQELQAPGTVYDDGPTVHTTSVNRTVWFEAIGPRLPGEQRTVAERSRQRVTVDRHGYYEAYLEPNTLYAVVLPTVLGKRYFRTGDPAAEGALEPLVDAALTTPLYALVP